MVWAGGFTPNTPGAGQSQGTASTNWTGIYQATNDLHAGYKCFTLANSSATEVILHVGDRLPSSAVHGGGAEIVAYTLSGDAGAKVYILEGGGGHVISLDAGQELHLLYR